MSKKRESKRIVLEGTVINAADYNPKATLGDLPGVKRTQIIQIQLEDNFWQIMHVKKVKIVIEEDQLPKEIRRK